jgi:hypothetical protein
VCKLSEVYGERKKEREREREVSKENPKVE